jgi:hypothetical protein
MLNSCMFECIYFFFSFAFVSFFFLLFLFSLFHHFNHGYYIMHVITNISISGFIVSLTSSMLVLDTLRKYAYQSEFVNNTLLPFIRVSTASGKGKTSAFSSKKDDASMV